MYEKVNPAHPDKQADRIAGAIVDLAYNVEHDPRIAVEVLLGHGHCFITIESSVRELRENDIFAAVHRILGVSDVEIEIIRAEQDIHLARNQEQKIRCGDNGIFRGVPVTEEERTLIGVAGDLYDHFRSDGKYIIDGKRLIICQSNAREEQIRALGYPTAEINPLGDWTGGYNVDSGATNRKLGSDMGGAVTGGGLHGKDLSKADVSVNIYAFLKAQSLGRPVEFCCAIGDESVGGVPYEAIVQAARSYIVRLGGFERFAEWGLIR